MKRSSIAQVLGCILMVFTAQVASASWIVAPTPWQKMISDSDFVGIVECKWSGVTKGPFKIIDIWKGELEDSSIQIADLNDLWGSPIHLVLPGEQFLIIGDFPNGTLTSSGIFGDGVEYLLGRTPPSSPTITLSQTTLRPLQNKETDFFDSGIKDLGQFKTNVLAFISLSDDAKELALLKAFTQRKRSFAYPISSPSHCSSNQFFTSKKSRQKKEATYQQEKARVMAEVNTLKSALLDTQSIDEFVTYMQTHDIPKVFNNDYDMHPYLEILLTVDGQKSLALIKKSTPETSIFTQQDLDNAFDDKKYSPNGSTFSFGHTFTTPGSDTPFSSSLITKPTQSELIAYQKILIDPEYDYYADDAMANAEQAYRIVCQYSPDFISDKLVSESPFTPIWDDSQWSFFSDTDAYQNPIYFAQYCGGDRKAQFTKLLGAKDPYVRTVGALYLSFEDHEAGMQALRQCAQIPGDVGAWAALNLLRRGEKEAMPRALELFKNSFANKSNTSSQGFNWSLSCNYGYRKEYELIKIRLLILLVNSCKASDVPLPSAIEWDKGALNTDYRKLIHWWEGHHDQITLYDPWFEELAAQKMD